MFVSLPSELDTRAIAVDAWAGGKRVTVPRAHMEDRSMEAVLIRSFEQDMQHTKIGVFEPIARECLSPSELDFVLVPGLGFGESGERIGRGAGFYDRFLARLPANAVTCGYGLEQQVTAGIPMTEHDTPIQMLVTDQRVRRFRT
jgi:5-formyltetrahydrofolate cyclo-ligase